MFAFLFHESMDPFYQNISSFPTAIYTVILGVCLVYWLGAVLGLFDLELLDLDGPDLDVDAHDGQPEVTRSHSPNVLAGLLLKLGLNGVPMTIIISFIALFGWGLCYFSVHLLNSFLPTGLVHYVAGVPILLATLYVSALITSVAIRPLRKLFKEAERNTVKTVLGQVAVVRTSYVDDSFGEATMADGGAGLILKVRAEAGDDFKKGVRVVPLEYNKNDNTYRIVSEAEFSG
jgi:hypothetical protein